MTGNIKRNVNDNSGFGRTISFIVLLAVVAIAVVCTLIGVHYFAGIDIPVVSIVNEGSAQYWGQLGDFFGGVLNPILSFLALVAVATSLSVVCTCSQMRILVVDIGKPRATPAPSVGRRNARSPRHGGTLQALAAVDGCALSPLTLPKGYGYPEGPPCSAT
ncbi:hypothetical protein [Pseudomonas sp. KCJK8927]|uniref:hypothetical protein n=1 Tax=Pseudomonas sp. KCJK8927 TaxID=3344560 RepID=UPI003905D9CB